MKLNPVLVLALFLIQSLVFLVGTEAFHSHHETDNTASHLCLSCFVKKQIGTSITLVTSLINLTYQPIEYYHYINEVIFTLNALFYGIRAPPQ